MKNKNNIQNSFAESIGDNLSKGSEKVGFVSKTYDGIKQNINEFAKTETGKTSQLAIEDLKICAPKFVVACIALALAIEFGPEAVNSIKIRNEQFNVTYEQSNIRKDKLIGVKILEKVTNEKITPPDYMPQP